MRANRLANEKSPYLQQHAHNPVDWYPWGQEAFDAARAGNKPIFLSIGYSTCHWCHVMERESFENDEIASLLNRDFVPVKVDREERPDIDRVYMTFVQASTGSGGWPMSVFLTPDLKPFFGATYFPPDTRYGRPGFRQVLESLANAWRTERDRIEESGKNVLEQLRDHAEQRPTHIPALDKGVIESGYNYFRRNFDTPHGGFGEAPKFPRPSVLNFLLRYYHRTRNEEALEMATATLRAMAKGGIHDQLGGGFHRYSVDELWHVPHFEKMLYDQAQLATAYLESYQITHDEYYADIPRDIFEYVLRDMTDAQGGFYSAEDADSAVDPSEPEVKAEGAFYVWTRAEVADVLAEKFEAEIFCDRYGIDDNGNVFHDPQNEFTGKNILFVRRDAERLASDFHMDVATMRSMLARLRERMRIVRSLRPRPGRDDKILTSWNSLMISAFAKGAVILEDLRYRDAALRAAGFLENNMYSRANGTLLRRYRDGDAAIDGFLDDYAFFALAQLDLYEMDFNPERIATAVSLARKMRELFEDKRNGGFYSTTDQDPSVVLRMKDTYDGAEPSGNSAAMMLLLRLAEFTNEAEFHESLARTMDALAPSIAHQPAAVPQMLAGLEFYLATKKQVVLVGGREPAGLQGFLRRLRHDFHPNVTPLVIDREETRRALEKLIPAIDNMKAEDGRPLAYVCENYTCQLPTPELSRFSELLQ